MFVLILRYIWQSPNSWVLASPNAGWILEENPKFETVAYEARF